MAKKITRRDFLKYGLIFSGSSIAACTHLLTNTPVEKGTAAATNTAVHLPLVSKNPSPQPTVTATVSPGTGGEKYPGRVAQVHAADAHNWNYSATNYWDSVNQNAIDRMLDEGIQTLTGKSNLADAWRALLPDYRTGQLVAIKVSFNNSKDETGSIGQIDGIIEPVNAIIRGLHQAGVPDDAIVVYDSSRVIPTRFITGCDYDVQFRDTNDSPWGGARITFHPPNTEPFDLDLSNVLTSAAYLINVPVLKIHGMAGISMGMKNHFGSIRSPKTIHPWSSLAYESYSASYNSITELNLHPEIAAKTILTVGDSIFGAFDNNNERSFPTRWVVFSNQSPKSLFLATDPVAIDCVMGDLINQEFIQNGYGAIRAASFDYLILAAEDGLGVYDRGDPLQNTYSKIELIKREV